MQSYNFNPFANRAGTFNTIEQIEFISAWFKQNSGLGCSVTGCLAHIWIAENKLTRSSFNLFKNDINLNGAHVLLKTGDVSTIEYVLKEFDNGNRYIKYANDHNLYELEYELNRNILTILTVDGLNELISMNQDNMVHTLPNDQFEIVLPDPNEESK